MFTYGALPGQKKRWGLFTSSRLHGGDKGCDEFRKEE